MAVVRSKICGITRIEDALAAAAAGADAIGLVFYPPSPRAVTPERAREIVACLPPFITVVGLFVNAGREGVESVLREVPLDLLQFHGDESPQDCRGFGRRYMKALRVRPGDDVLALCGHYADAAGILLDAWVPGVPGGTGQCFDWSLVPANPPLPLILAGGLDAGNVAEAIARVQPWGVDVSGGVEAAKGIKDVAKVQAFLQAVRSA